MERFPGQLFPGLSSWIICEVDLQTYRHPLTFANY
jgi:hypothetical protein